MMLLFTTTHVKSNTVGTPSHILVIVIFRSYFGRNFPQLFAVRICRSCFPLLFVVAIYRGNQQHLPTVAICLGHFPWVSFVYVCKPFFYAIKSFFFVNNSFLIKSKPFQYMSKTVFIYVNFFINSVSFCYCRGSYRPP